MSNTGNGCYTIFPGFKSENDVTRFSVDDLINLEKEEKGLVDKTKDEIKYTSALVASFQEI